MKTKFLCFLILLYTISSNFSTVYAENISASDKSNEEMIDLLPPEKMDEESIGDEKIYDKNTPWPSITSQAAVVIDAKTGVVIYEKNKNSLHYPASTTKVMTSLLLMEYIEKNENKKNERVEMSHEAVFGIAPDSSKIYMDVGETLTLEQALYAIMLKSANEVSVAVAEHIAGNEADFAKMMTEKAIALGASNTQFTNAHGLHEEEHFTTPLDLAKIMQAALAYPLFVEVISTVEYDIPPTERFEETRHLVNSNRLIQESSSLYNPNCVGSKTGYTDKAQHTLVTLMKDGEKEIITVVMEGEGRGKFIDTTELSMVAFQKYDDFTILPAKSFSKYIPVYISGVLTGQLFVESIEPLIVSLPQEPDENSIIWSLDLPTKVDAFLDTETIIGSLQAVVENAVLGKVDLLVSNFVPLTISYYNDTQYAQPVFSSGDDMDIVTGIAFVNYPRLPETLKKDARFFQWLMILPTSLLVIIIGISTSKLQKLKKEKQKKAARARQRGSLSKER